MLIAQHRSLEERIAAARAGVTRLGLPMPVFVDGIDNAVSDAFAAWPERIFVVDRDARIAFAGGPGPFEFAPDAAATALEALL